MEYEIICEPFLFMETMEMLHRHVCQFRYPSLWQRRRSSNGADNDETVLRRLEQLQRIMESVCRDVDRKDPRMKKWFTPLGTDHPSSTIYMARFCVTAFLNYEHTGFDDTVEDILKQWQQMGRLGAWLRRSNGDGMDCTLEPGCPGDLFAQVCALDLPADFRLQLYGVLRRFPESLAELTALMRPAALRLEEALKKEGFPMEEMAYYWLNHSMTPLEFLNNSMGPDSVKAAGERVRIGIALMDANRIHFNTDGCDYGIPRDFRYIYIGCGISASSLLQEHSNALDEISTVLRGLSERKRLEALSQLSKKRLYGQELADLLNMDRGNLSRLLGVLHEQGFLRQEKENQRIYYRADRAALQHFFDSILSVLFD